MSALPEPNGWIAAREVAVVWAGLDETAASAWVDSLPPGVLKARAAGALIAGTSADRKPEAQALLDTLTAHDRGVAEAEANDRR